VHGWVVATLARMMDEEVAMTRPGSPPDPVVKELKKKGVSLHKLYMGKKSMQRPSHNA
jgi:hypothetical protein